MRRRGLGGAGLCLLVLVGAASACGRYGPPVRAREYREAEKAEQQAEEERKRGSTPESRNEPLPAAP